MTAYLLSQAEKYSREEYLSRLELQLAVERAFIIIGEAMVLLKKYHPDVYFDLESHAAAIGFRNFLVHRYWDVDHEEVWLTLTAKVPPLKSTVDGLIERLDTGV